jgi:hypothetical protein
MGRLRVSCMHVIKLMEIRFAMKRIILYQKSKLGESMAKCLGLLSCLSLAALELGDILCGYGDKSNPNL